LLIFRDSVFHSDISKRIYNLYDVASEDIFWGVAIFKSGKLDFFDFDEGYIKEFYKKWHGKDDWTKQYFNDNFTNQLNVYYKKKHGINIPIKTEDKI
jgi:hypothetical protein